MVVSCLTLLFPGLAEKFGLKGLVPEADAATEPVSAAHKTALQNALTAYSNAANNDAKANAALHVAEALQPVLADLAYTPRTWPSASISHGSMPWIPL